MSDIIQVRLPEGVLSVRLEGTLKIHARPFDVWIKQIQAQNEDLTIICVDPKTGDETKVVG